MHVASGNGHLAVVEALISMRANIEERNKVHEHMHASARTHTHTLFVLVCAKVGGWVYVCRNDGLRRFLVYQQAKRPFTHTHHTLHTHTHTHTHTHKHTKNTTQTQTHTQTHTHTPHTHTNTPHTLNKN